MIFIDGITKKICKDKMALMGLVGVLFLLAIAIFAPFIANGRPFVISQNGELSFPFFHFIFSPDPYSSEVVVEKLFNYVMIMIPVALGCHFITFRKNTKLKLISIIVLGVLILIPFIFSKGRMDKTNWREKTKNFKEADYAIFAPVPYNPSEIIGEPYQKPTLKNYLGTDNIGRDVLSRMIYGARVSLAVGILATTLAISIGLIIGMISGFYGGKPDIIIMRIVEVIICFPTFLLLLILMAIMLEKKINQSILLVISIIGITGWTGLCRLVRGEVLKLRTLPYVQSCVTLGLPTWRIMLFHLLPNITGVIMVNFTFSVAGAILAESGLSFLGFGVQPPTSSWGELLRQSFNDPQTYWCLVLWPGLALFIAVCSFNFVGEGLRRALDPKTTAK